MWYVHAGLYFKQALSHWVQQPVRNLQLIRGLWQMHWFPLRHWHAPNNTRAEQALCVRENHSQYFSECSVDPVFVFHQLLPTALWVSLLFLAHPWLHLFLSKHESSCKHPLSSLQDLLLSFHQNNDEKVRLQTEEGVINSLMAQRTSPSLQQVNGELAV